ncbi:ATP-binding cassette domain-containing protein, partial [Caldilinea sp.]|uniref:ABC transporter ATP-binding protein n=1 Tax=Caldilinea sp. TaxID=2293560 RepID=UPI002CC3A730|nr:ATP-binding cassette domain-containing protein [Caldilinea sp.]
MRALTRRQSTIDVFFPLKDVSLRIETGDFLGILGPNGAGKSTLLKLITGIIPPTAGDLTVNGRVCSLLELGAGFHPDLTGRENIYLNGSIYGMSRREIDK